jgi:diphosphomevalonate decarboxylase
LVDKGEKQVSSTVGHDLMHNHPFAKQRFEQAHTNLSSIKKVLENGNIEEFIKIVESEALTLTCHDDDFYALFYFDET